MLFRDTFGELTIVEDREHEECPPADVCDCIRSYLAHHKVEQPVLQESADVHSRRSNAKDLSDSQLQQRHQFL